MADLCSPFRMVIIGAVAAACGALASPAFAGDADSKLKVTGFLSVVGGRTFGPALGNDYVGPTSIKNNDCPCYIADWGNAGIYRESLSFTPESRAGVQFKYSARDDINLVAQIVTRGSDPKPNLQWAYASYAPSKNWEIQVGRKRIPLYYYSDFQDIGVAYPWVTVPPELYGWEATNYNGVSARYKGHVGDTNLTASAFGGKETVKDSLYMKLYYDGETKVTWGNLIGGDLELSHGPLTTRVVYMQAHVRTINQLNDLDDSARLRAYGIAANLDLDEWFVLSELTQLTRDFQEGYRVTAPAFTVGAGYHMGDWTPFLNYASYKETTDHLELYAPQSFKRASLTLRYDLDTKSAVKAQVDRERDVTHNFGGNLTVLRFAYDRLF